MRSEAGSKGGWNNLARNSCIVHQQPSGGACEYSRYSLFRCLNSATESLEGHGLLRRDLRRPQRLSDLRRIPSCVANYPRPYPCVTKRSDCSCCLATLTAAVGNWETASGNGARNLNFIIVVAHRGPAPPPRTRCSADVWCEWCVLMYFNVF